VTAELPRNGRIAAGIYLYPVRVYYEDTDAGGVVYHASYLRFAERARSEMLRQLGVRQEEMRTADGLFLVMRRATIDFLAPARLDDDLVVATRLAAMGGASLDLVQEISRDGTLLARLGCRIACLSRSGRPTRLPPPLRAAVHSLSPISEMDCAHAR
jgi:acyl-CoA thioester hydrolase